MALFKVNKNRDYTVMSNHHLRDKELSLKAKGLLSYMLSLPDDWDYSLNGLVAICKESRDAIKSALKELKDHSYLKIERSRGQNGKFEYTYSIYEEPFNEVSKNQNLPMTDFPATVESLTGNPTQINTKEQIDKNDKTKITHNILTLELINQQYITEDDISSFYFDDLFEKYLSEGHSYKELVSCIHYIVPRVLYRDFIDEDGFKIENKFGYFKNAIEANFEKLDSLSKRYYDDDFEL